MCTRILLDQISLTKVVAPTLNYQVSVNRNFKVLEKFTAEGRDRATLSVFRPVSSSVRPTVFSTVAPRGRWTPASASPHAHACRVRILAPDTPPTGARAAVALPRNRASRRQGHWPSPLPSTRLFAARSTSPWRCPALECPARLGCSRPRLENHSASLSPRRRPPLQCLCTTHRLTLSPPPSSSNQ